MFTSMRARHFKSWQDTGDLVLRPITGFFGKNSSGKTSLLQLLLLLKQTAASADPRQVLNLGGDERSPASLGLIQDVYYQHDLTQEMSFDFRWNLPEGNTLTASDPMNRNKSLFESDWLSFSSRLAVAEKEQQLYVERFRYEAEHLSVTMTSSKAPRHRKDPEYSLEATANGNSSYLIRAQGRPWPLPPPAKCYGFPDEVSAYFQNAGFVSALELELERQFGSRLFYLGPLRSYPLRQYTWQGARPVDVGRAGERAVDAILASRARGETNARRLNQRGRAIRRITMEAHVAALLKDLDLISSFAVEPVAKGADIYRVTVERSEGSTPVLLTDVGFGVSQVLPVLVLLAYVDEGSTVLLEQPEIHLHPAVQADLADAIIEIATVRRIQVIVESHSEHLMKRLQRRVAEQRVDSDVVTLYFCEHTRRGSAIERLELNSRGEIANWPTGFFGDPFGETAAIVQAGLQQQLSESDL